MTIKNKTQFIKSQLKDRSFSQRSSSFNHEMQFVGSKKNILAIGEVQKNILLEKQHNLIVPVVSAKKSKSKSKKNHAFNQSFMSQEQIKQVIVNPVSDTSQHLKELISLKIQLPSVEKPLLTEEEIAALNKIETDSSISLINLVIGHDIFEKHIPEELIKHKVKKILLLTDTEYTHKLKSYNKLISSFKESGVEFVEFTNIQPELNKKLVWKIAKFATDNNVDTVFAFGSFPLIDLSKIVVIKMTKHSIWNLNKINTKLFTESPYKAFSLSTVVAPDTKINASTSLRCNTIFKSNALLNTISLFTSIDKSDTAFFFPEILAELSNVKLFEVLHETFFRTMLNFFAKNNSVAVKDQIIQDLNSLKAYAMKLQKAEEKFSLQDLDQISILIMKTVDGSTYIENIEQWRWFSLECSLNLMVNSPKSHGLALFAPNYFKYEAKYNKHFKVVALELAKKLFNCETIEGLVLNLLRYNEQFDLPKVLFDITQLKKLTPSLLLSLTKKASYFVVSYRSSKAIVHNLPVW